MQVSFRVQQYRNSLDKSNCLRFRQNTHSHDAYQIQIGYYKQDFPVDWLEPELLRGKRVLDIGGRRQGSPLVRLFRSKGIEAFSIDRYLDPECASKIHIQGRADQLSDYFSKPFDYIYSSSSVYSSQLPQDNVIFKRECYLEAARLLKPGGKLRLANLPFTEFQSLYPQIQAYFEEPVYIRSDKDLKLPHPLTVTLEMKRTNEKVPDKYPSSIWECLKLILKGN